MNTPTPEEAREALDKLVVYANNGWGSACPVEVDTLRRFIDAHSAPVMVNGLTEAETAETASVAGLSTDLKRYADTIERLTTERDNKAADLASTQIAWENWKVIHSTLQLEVSVQRLQSELTALRAAQGEPVAWIPVAERMPTAGAKVLVLYANSYGRTRRTCAHYSPKHTVDTSSTWDEGEPDETEDGWFEPEGWWEEPVEIERVQFISDEVTHWMPLPAHPDASPPPAQPATDADNKLGQHLQQRCVDWGAYWRASDAHGVNLTLGQALELLRTALGVEVEIADAAQPPQAEPVADAVAIEIIMGAAEAMAQRHHECMLKLTQQSANAFEASEAALRAAVERALTAAQCRAIERLTLGEQP